MADSTRIHRPQNSVLEKLVNSYYKAVKENSTKSEDALNAIRFHVLQLGAQCEIWEKKLEEEQVNKLSEDAMSDTVRGNVWKTLVGINEVNPEQYLESLERGANGRKSFCYADIRHDTKRTYPSVSLYRNRVPEKILVRILNCYCQVDDCPGYVQGMNAVAGALLIVMPELDAYHCFYRISHDLCPTYFNKEYNIVGAYAGAFLVHDCLKICDAELYSKLELVHPYCYAFPAVSSIYAVAPPLTELLKLWDFEFSFGIHFNILCVAAQVINERDLVFENDADGRRSSRKWSAINAQEIIATVKRILPIVQEDSELWKNICLHTTDFALASRIKDHGTKKILLKSNRSHRRFESKPIAQAPDT